MKKLIALLAAVGIIIIIFGTICAAVQQSQRHAANYPQIQMAEDTADQIKGGADPYIASTLSPVNMKDSLAPFTIVYDKKGDVVSGSGYLDGKVPKAPIGVLENAKGKEYNAVTWQPQDNVRIAAVSVAAKDYYVLSGRSLTEVEKNENETFKITFVGGALALLIMLVALVARSLAGGGLPHPPERSA
jgi:hypothetical protein